MSAVSEKQLTVSERLIRTNVRRYTVDQFMSAVRMSGISFSHDEREILVTSNRSGIFNAYSIPITGGAPRQLTFSTDESIKTLSFFPNDRRILYFRDKGGCENRHLCVGEEDGREVELTEGKNVKSGFRGFSGEGRHFYFASNERTHQHFDIYSVDVQTYHRRLLFENDDGYIFAGMSPEGDIVALIKYEEFGDSDVYLFHVKSGSLQLITPHTGKACYLPLYFDDNCRTLYYRALETEHEGIEYRFDLRTGTREEVARKPATFRENVISESRRYEVEVSDQREGSSMVMKDRSTGSVIPLGTLPQGKIFSAKISKSDRWLAFYNNGDRDPTELYAYDLSEHRLSRLTSNVNEPIRREDLVESVAIEFKSFDGMSIPGLLWKPHEASCERKVPGLIWVHGGPVGQIRKGYAGAVQFLVNHGYAVLGVNHRGSNGYGNAFLNAADRKQGREPLWDCVEAKRYLAKLDYIDPNRIGIIGGSFGGYMTLAALTFHPEEFEAGVAICGVSNLVRFLESRLIEPYGAPLYLQKVGDPVKDRAMLEAVSPALHAEQIKKPLMVLHGTKDPRAYKIESDDIVSAVRANGGIVEYLEFDDEAHGFRKRANSVRAYQAILEFLDQHMLLA